MNRMDIGVTFGFVALCTVIGYFLSFLFLFSWILLFFTGALLDYIFNSSAFGLMTSENRRHQLFLIALGLSFGAIPVWVFISLLWLRSSWGIVVGFGIASIAGLAIMIGGAITELVLHHRLEMPFMSLRAHS